MITSIPSSEIFYPESDGKPVAENTIQFDWIQILYGELDEQFRDQSDVFVAGDFFWYPVEGDPSIVQAPDVMLAFGRPKGHRSSYRQWVEGGIAPQVVFEIFSPSNGEDELEEKFSFYQLYGVEEYYLIDPYEKTVDGYRRRKNLLTPIHKIGDWKSPRLGIRFVKESGDLFVVGPDGRRFVKRVERVTALLQRTETLAAKLRELGVDPDSLLK
jgi:Uma2 family endonuclease